MGRKMIKIGGTYYNADYIAKVEHSMQNEEYIFVTMADGSEDVHECIDRKEAERITKSIIREMEA